MDSQKEYWRDKVLQLLGWGTGALIVVAGWSIDKSKSFELGPFAKGAGDLGNAMRGVALLLFAGCFGVAWYLAVRSIYLKHLQEGVDSTVIPWKPVRRYVITIVTLLWLVSIVVVLL